MVGVNELRASKSSLFWHSSCTAQYNIVAWPQLVACPWWLGKFFLTKKALPGGLPWVVYLLLFTLQCFPLAQLSLSPALHVPRLRTCSSTGSSFPFFPGLLCCTCRGPRSVSSYWDILVLSPFLHGSDRVRIPSIDFSCVSIWGHAWDLDHSHVGCRKTKFPTPSK